MWASRLKLVRKHLQITSQIDSERANKSRAIEGKCFIKYQKLTKLIIDKNIGGFRKLRHCLLDRSGGNEFLATEL